MRIFIGVDERQPLAFNVLQWSLHWNASEPIQITPLLKRQLPITKFGLTDFTYSRYLVPWLCGFEGRALFMDADMVMTDGADICQLFKIMEDRTFSVAVNKELPKYEWPSMMLFDCRKWNYLTPDAVNRGKAIEWDDPPVVAFPPEWNHMVTVGDRGEPPPATKVIHYTQGIPVHFETLRTSGASVFHAYKRHMLHSVTWADLMAKSVHVQPVLIEMGRYYERKARA